MDEVLKRPLFRNKARHYEQIKTNNVGKHYLGVFSQIPKMYQAGKAGLSAFNAAQAARGSTNLYKYVGQPIGKFIEKNPKLVGGAETALGIQQLYEGGKDIYEGVSTDNPSKTAEGGANLLFGKSFTRGGIGRFRTGKTPIGSVTQELVAPLGLYGASFALPDGTVNQNIEAAEKSLGRKLTETERTQAIEFIKNKMKGGEKEITPGTAGDPRGETYYNPMADIAYSPTPVGPKSSLEQSFGDMSNADIIAGGKPISGGTTTGGSSTPPSKPNPGQVLDNAAATAEKQVQDLKDSSSREVPTNYTIEKLGNKIVANEKAGSDLVSKATSLADKGDSDAAAFKKFYKDFQNMTGGGPEMSDLIMLKLATGLLSGTTTKPGFAGFAEVLGKAGEGTVDTAIKLAAMEKEKKQELALAYLKNKSLNGVAGISADRTYYIEKDPNAIGGQKLVEKARFSEGPYKGYDAKAVPVLDPNTKQYVPQWVVAEYNPSAIQIKPDPKLIDERTAQLHSLATSFKMANKVSQLPEDLLGTPGKIKLLKEEVIGALGSTFRSEFVPGDYQGSTDDYINKVILRGDSDMIAKKEKEVQDYVNSQTKLFQRPSAEELTKLTEAARIEVNLKYAYANGLKDTDRLTEKNLEDAAKVTSIFGFVKSPRSVKERFKQLAEDASTRFEAEIPRFQQVGGQNYYLENAFGYMPAISKYKSVQQQVQEKQAVQSKIKPIIESIPGYQ
jgi:hypothetical protein